MPLLHLANALLTGALVASMALTYGALPERQPRHFGFDGSGDAWIFTTPAQVWLLLLIGPGTALL